MIEDIILLGSGGHAQACIDVIEQANNFIIQRQLELKSSKLLRDLINEATIEYK